jgi:hypothetical protein
VAGVTNRSRVFLNQRFSGFALKGFFEVAFQALPYSSTFYHYANLSMICFCAAGFQDILVILEFISLNETEISYGSQV